MLAARITAWGGAAGNRIADVGLTNAGSQTCTLPAMDKPQLVDGTGSVLIDGVNPTSTTRVSVTPGGSFRRHAYNQVVRLNNPSGRRE